MQRNHNNSREAKAQELLQSGAVSLFVGQGYALVQGSGSNVYRVTKDGCTCPDRQKRGQPCKHEIAVRSLCSEYRAWNAKAEQGERIRPSSALLQAIRWPEKPEATGCQECGAPTDFDVCSGCFFGQRDAA